MTSDELSNAGAGAPAAEDGETVATERLKAAERANRDKDELLARERKLRAQLEEAHVAKDRILAVLSQDLRTPINAVLGWTQLLRREKLDQHSRDRALATIERNARAQLRLVEELLDISRLGAGNVQLERASLDLGEIVQRCADALALTAHDRGVQLRLTPCPETLVVAGDRRRLEQVMTNLLTNALDATPAGGRVAVRTTREALAARIIVEDTGRGIEADVLPHVFEPFRRASDETTPVEGLGLGLYIVRQSLEMHSGSIVAESEGAGRGARFTVTLPLIAAPSRDRADRARASVSGDRAHPSWSDRAQGSAPTSHPPPSRGVLQGISVLVVDDEEDARDLLATLLRHRGAAVTAASDVTTALAAFEASPADVVVSDLGMPGRDGFDLARDLRARPNVVATLIAVSGFASADEVARALDAGFDVHLAKPIEPAELIALIRDAAHPRSSAARSSAAEGPVSRAVGSQDA